MGTRARILLAFCASCVLFCATSAAPAAVLSAGEVLRVTFTTSAGALPVPDQMSLHLGTVQVLAAHTRRTAALFDGETLLGEGSSTSFGSFVGALSLNPARSFRSATSLYTFGEPAVADFTPIVAGTIDGRVDFTIATGAMDINLANVRLTMGIGTGPSSTLQSSPQPTVTSVQIIPEPAAAGAVTGVALLVIGMRTGGSRRLGR